MNPLLRRLQLTAALILGLPGITAIAAVAGTPPPAAAPVAADAATPDEFKPVDGFPAADEFKSFDDPAEHHENGEFRGEARAFRWVIAILGATVLAGVLVRFPSTRNLRAVFLVGSVAVLGFYKGGCPCPIQSLQYALLNLLGHAYKWQTILYFTALIPITYFLGRIYCGWICSLGAIQEFMFLGSRIRILQSERAQAIMRGIRLAALAALIVQLAITQTNLFKKIDPFAVIFNHRSTYAFGWALVAVLVASSVLIFRPFCRTACPVGLVLGWVSRLPGASILGSGDTCLSCSICRKACKSGAITRDGAVSVIDNQDCIRCGECLGECRKSALRTQGNRGPWRHRNTLQGAAGPVVVSAARAPLAPGVDAVAAAGSAVEPPRRPRHANGHSAAAAGARPFDRS